MSTKDVKYSKLKHVEVAKLTIMTQEMHDKGCFKGMTAPEIARVLASATGLNVQTPNVNMIFEGLGLPAPPPGVTEAWETLRQLIAQASHNAKAIQDQLDALTKRIETLEDQLTNPFLPTTKDLAIA